jgi:hypothetical protein
MPVRSHPILTAADLRQSMAERIAEKRRAEAIAQAKAQHSHDEFVSHFLHDHLSRKDIAILRVHVVAAAARGEFALMIMRFPSALCSDDGRAIGNAEPGWPRTLPGKAREAHRLWARLGRPHGYGLRAAIIDYPGGIPGDVGLFLDWSPPASV